MASRNSGLQISLEVLERLPFPVLAVTGDHKIELFNQRVDGILGGTVESGGPIELSFPEPVAKKIVAVLEGQGGQGAVRMDVAGKRLSLLVRSLRPSDPYRGLIIIEHFGPAEDKED